MKRDYVHLDVFADRAFHGNQLAVATDAAGLDASTCCQMGAKRGDWLTSLDNFRWLTLDLQPARDHRTRQ
jgi:hypothetical protein